LLIWPISGMQQAVLILNMLRLVHKSYVRDLETYSRHRETMTFVIDHPRRSPLLIENASGLAFACLINYMYMPFMVLIYFR